MTFPEIEDIQIIVASYVANDELTLINLLHYWGIYRLLDLSGTKHHYFEEKQMKLYNRKLFEYMNFVVRDSKTDIKIPKSVKNILFSTKCLENNPGLIQEISDCENINLYIYSEFSKELLEKLFSGKKYKRVSISDNLLLNSDIECEELILISHITTEGELKINSVTDLVLKCYIPKNTIFPKNSIKGLYSEVYNNLSNFLSSESAKNLIRLKVILNNISKMQDYQIDNLLNLDLHISGDELFKIEGTKFIAPLTRLNLTDLAISSCTKQQISFRSISLLSNPDFLKKLKFKFRTYPDEFITVQDGKIGSILWTYKNLESFSFIHSDTKYLLSDGKHTINLLPPSIKKITIKFESKSSEKVLIPRSVESVQLKLHGKLKKNIIECEAPENVRSISIKVETEMSMLIHILNSILPKMINLESINIESKVEDHDLIKLTDLLFYIPENTINIILDCYSIKCNEKIINFRKFKKLRYLKINTSSECNFCDPVVLLPRITTGIMYVKIDVWHCNKKHKLKNISGLYVEI